MFERELYECKRMSPWRRMSRAILSRRHQPATPVAFVERPRRLRLTVVDRLKCSGYGTSGLLV
jgi:hypothetical protein